MDPSHPMLPDDISSSPVCTVVRIQHRPCPPDALLVVFLHEGVITRCHEGHGEVAQHRGWTFLNRISEKWTYTLKMNRIQRSHSQSLPRPPLPLLVVAPFDDNVRHKDPVWMPERICNNRNMVNQSSRRFKVLQEITDKNDLDLELEPFPSDPKMARHSYPSMSILMTTVTRWIFEVTRPERRRS